MAWIQPVAALVLAIVIPFVVNLCTTSITSGTTKRLVAIAFSLVAGVATAFLTGIPTPENLVTWAFAVIGGVQTAYTAFKAVGVTSNALEALQGIGNKADE